MVRKCRCDYGTQNPPSMPKPRKSAFYMVQIHQGGVIFGLDLLLQKKALKTECLQGGSGFYWYI
jgi:hypothetical protein